MPGLIFTLLNLDIDWGPSCTFKKYPTPCPVPWP